MPNWCDNTLTITGDRDKILKLWEALNNGAGFLATLRPEPDYEKVEVDPAFPSDEGKPDPMPAWWNWRVQNWGTKWEVDTEGQVHFECDDDGNDNRLFVYFESAWSPPLEALQYYAEKNPDTHVDIKYYEAGMGFIGQWNSDGVDDYYDDVSKHLKIKPEDNPSLYELMDEFNVWADYDEDEDDK